MHPEVKFPREIHEGLRGKDIVAHKRALSRWNHNVYPWTQFTDYAGPAFIDAVVKYKKMHGLGTLPKIGTVAHDSLERAHRYQSTTEWAFDQTAINLAQEYYDEVTVSPEEKIRGAIVDAAFFWYSQRYRISYSQTRPFELGRPPWVPTKWDCSAFVTNCYFAANASDPNGLGYNHEGYTGTLMDHGTKVPSVENLKLGDLIFYGYSSGKPGFHSGDPTHVAVYVGVTNGNHMVVSNGSFPMRWTQYNYRSDLNHYRHYEIGV